MNRLSVIATMILMSGCQTMQTAQLKNKLSDCKDLAMSTPEFKRLRASHSILDSVEKKSVTPTPDELNDSRYATDDDISDIISLHNSMAVCRKEIIEKVAEASPSSIPALVNGFWQSDVDRADLIERKITWGTYAKNYAANVSSSQKRIRADALAAESAKRIKNDADWQQASDVAGKVAKGGLDIALTALSIWATSQTTLYRNPSINYGVTAPLITNCTANTFGYGTSTTIRCTNY